MEPAVLSGEAPSFVSQVSGSIRRPSQILAAAVRKTSLDVSLRPSHPVRDVPCSAQHSLRHGI